MTRPCARVAGNAFAAIDPRMRASFFLLASAMLLVGCGPGADPALGACAARKPAQMTLGTGQDKFEPLQGSIVVQIGPAGQGGA